jgi:thiol-disulfide isomerase/thioredoxin
MGSFGSVEVDRLERLDARAFDGQKLRRNGTWAVAFLAEWCPFCHAFAPEFARLGNGSNLAVGDLTDYDGPLWDVFGIEVVPTVLVFRDGEIVYRANGVLGEGLGPRDVAAVRRALATP